MNRKKDSNGSMTGASDRKLNTRISNRITTLVKNRKHSKVRRALATTLACFIVFTTTYSLILPAISVELETADQVGIVLPEEGLIDGTETTENTAYPEDASFEEAGEETEPAAGATSSYQESEAANLADEGLVDGDISADIVGENGGEIISESEEAAGQITGQPDDTSQIANQSEEDAADPISISASADEGDLSADDLNTVLTLTASAENVDLKLTYPQEIPEGSSATFNPVDSAYYDNYYYSAKDVLEENNTGWEVTEGQFWNVVAAPGIDVEVELDYQELSGVSDAETGARYALIDWSDEEWHLYDDEKVAVAFNEEGVLDRVNFRTDALYNGAAVFGVLTLEERREAQGEITEDVTAPDGNIEGEYTENAQVSDIDAAGGTAGAETGSADETAAAETAQTDETAVTDGAQTEETSVSDAVQTDESAVTDGAQTEEAAAADAAHAEESIGSEAAAGEETQAEDDAKPAEAADENAQNDSDEQAQTVSDSEKADAEGTAAPEDQEKEDVSTEHSEDAQGTEGDEASDTAEAEQEAKEEADSDEESADEKEAKDEAEYPAQLFSSEGDVSVYVTAPEGAFPADTKMIVTPVDNEDDIANITDVVSDSSIRKIQAVDIAFFDKDGNEIEPKVPIRVRLVADRMESDEDAVVVHVNDNGSAEKVEDASITTSGNQAYITVRTGEEAVISEENDSDKNETGAETAADDESGISAEASVESALQEAKLHNTVTADNEQGQNANPAEDILENGNQAGNISENANPAENSPEYANQFENSLEDINKVGTADQTNATLNPDEEHDSDSLTAEFEAAEFSIYAVVYTVDFEYSVDGKAYDFSIPGGGFVSFEHLVEELGIGAGDTNSGDAAEETGLADESTVENAETMETTQDPENAFPSYDDAIRLNEIEVSETAKQFVADVASVEFSNPELVWIGKINEAAAVGDLKEANRLEVEYSADLTEEQIAEINAQTVESGDWALISVRPFTSEETLTVTMKDGEVFTVKVTDAQISTQYLSDSGELYEVTVTYSEAANIPDGSRLRITEFSEDDAEYEYARNSVLTDKKARGEWVDLSSFGLAALDISILNPEGEEIEPEAPVQVDIRIKELPGVEDLGEVENTLAIQHHVEVEDGVVVETVFNGNTDASFKLETNETVAAEGTAVDPDSASEEDFGDPGTVILDDPDIEFEVMTFSTFTISWNYAHGNGTRIHYVDESGHDLTVNNTTLPTTIGEKSTSPAYLIYDIEGYEYSYTYYESVNTRIYPQLFQASQWVWNTYHYGWAYYNSNGQGAFLDDNKDIYVVYKKKDDIAQGGTPTVKQSGDVKPPVAPRINKESTPNGDDTNTLALSLISDTAVLEVEKLADVIVVFDVSGSMSTNDMGGKTRLKAAQDAVNNLAEQLAKKKNSSGAPLVRMSLIQFSTKASTVLGMTDLTNDGVSQIKAAVNGLSAAGGTNWDHALQLANEENDLDSGRATFVIFVTDGDPTFRNTRMDVTDLQLQGETNDQALNMYGQEVPNNWYLSDGVYGPGDNDKTGQCYNAAVVQGNAIVSAKKNIYTIGISNDVTKVQTFNTAIHGNGAYLADNSSALQQAFSDIEASISGMSGWGNIKMTDGITNLTNTVQKTGLTNVGGDFTYWRAPAPANWASMTDEQKNAYKPAASDFVAWDPEAAGAALAEYNETTHAVEWNMGSTFMPEAGVTYQVRFKVWPSQEAYDYIAKLNNGTLNYDSLPAEVKAQIIKNGTTYTLKTNEPNANTTYQPATKTGNTINVSGETKTLMFPSVVDLNLSADKLKVQKEWVNSLDPDSRWKSPVTLLLTDGAGNLYKSIDLNEGNSYSAEDNFISCGLAKIEQGELIIYEKGHDFKLTEPEEYAYYWDLDAQIYRPMIIDAVLTMLVKTDAPSGMGDRTYYTEQGAKYYKIDGGTYKAISTGDAAAAITATNIRRSNLNLTKKVVDEEGNLVISSDAFTFTISINDAKDAEVWFSVQTDANDTNTIVEELSTNATAELKDGEKTGYYHAASGSQITVSIQPGWNLRFTNLSNGTTYTITENAKENYSFKNAVIDNNGTFSVESGTTTGTGTINESDKQYTVTYTNIAVTQQVYIQKTAQDAQTPLKGAVFSLYTKDGYEVDPQKAMKTGLESGADGKIDLGRLAIGEYYLVETSAPAGYILLTDPVTITVKDNKVEYEQISNSISSSGDGVSGGRNEGYTLIVTNNAGYELPSTGGPGTRLFTILGSVLILGAGALLWRRRRTI